MTKRQKLAQIIAEELPRLGTSVTELKAYEKALDLEGALADEQLASDGQIKTMEDLIQYWHDNCFDWALDDAHEAISNADCLIAELDEEVK